MKQGLLLGFVLIGIIIFAFEKFDSIVVINSTTINQQSDVSKTKNNVSEKTKDALAFCKIKKYNTNFCFFINYNIHSGLQRFFIWDFKLNQIIDSGLVSHGCSNNQWGKDDSKATPNFSNKEESHCSSLGKYVLKERGYSQWGINIKYNLQGLEKTNNNALKRHIVLHSWEAVSDANIYPNGTPEGWGCPAVSNAFMKTIDELIQKQINRKILLWIYN